MSNVCVAKELHRNGLGYEIVAKSKLVAQGWGNNLANFILLLMSIVLVIPVAY